MKLTGFIDIQVNGYLGVDFSSSTLKEDDFLFATQALIKNGTSVFLPTLVSCSSETYQTNLGIISDTIKKHNLQQHIPGIHLEGPFLSNADPGARGAHLTENIKLPSISFLDKLIKWSDNSILLITIAAEQKNADILCKFANNKGITVSLGHHMASHEELNHLIRFGAECLTHLGNGLPKFLPRHKNPFWAGMANDDLMATIITDGHHIPVNIIKSIVRTKGIDNVIIISDASPITGLQPGKYKTLGNNVVLENTGYLHNPETGYMVGSASTILDCVNYMLSLNIFAPQDIFKMAFENPLKLIKIKLEVIDTSHRLVYVQNENKVYSITG